MSILDRLVTFASETTKTLQPLTLPRVPFPSASIGPISTFLHHVTSRPVHPTYFPYVLFGVMHAAWVTTVWVQLTRKRAATKGRVGVLQDLMGYLTMACE
jgi:hypothetical protein